MTMNADIEISIVSPVYMAENIVDELVKQLIKILDVIGKSYEIILVEDASPDCSWDKIRTNCDKYPQVKGLKLSRNFGQQRAIAAGLTQTKGTWVVVMDCDLQDSPDEIPNLYHTALQGYDIVFAKRTQRQDSYFRLITSDINHRLFSFLSDAHTDRSLTNFGIYHARVIKQCNDMQEIARSFPVLVRYLGFNQTSVEVKHAHRFSGKSSYTLGKLLYQSIDAIMANSNKPLYISVTIGFIISLVAFMLAAYDVIAYFTGLILVPGFTTTIFSIWFSTGIIVFNLGMVGIYIGKIFDQVKGRPLFIIDKIYQSSNKTA